MGVGMRIGRVRGRAAAASAEQLPKRVLTREWFRWYAKGLVVTDTLTVLLAIGLAQWAAADTIGKHGILSAALVVLWLAALWLAGARSSRVIGAGSDEYRRVLIASFQTAGAIAIVAQLQRVDVARGFLAVALLAGMVGLVVSRIMWRGYVARLRAQGRFQTVVMAIGDGHDISLLVHHLTRNPRDGYRVAGIGIPGYGSGRGESVTINGRSIPIVGDEMCALGALDQLGADTVAITGTEHFGIHGLRRLTSQLDALDVALVVSPGVLDVAEARLHLGQFPRRAFDVGFSLAALILTAPVLVAVAVAIRITSRGPVFDRSERIGLHGAPFSMLTFRSVVTVADQRVDALVAGHASVSDVLFKMLDEPRITPVGRLIRRFGIDQLPQLLNVLRRDMSVVGPRPPLRREVATYDGDARRSLLVRPGITGLWRVRGDSELFYTENWSVVSDLVLIAKTVRAGLGRDDAT
jgi:lipopolysaccharide/colanic/teichoic acid biosynthesis glycosyltransferase